MSNPPPSSARCPVCGDKRARDFAPFCSRRCQDRDLLAWLGDGYRLPGDEAADLPDSTLDNRLDGD